MEMLLPADWMAKLNDARAYRQMLADEGRLSLTPDAAWRWVNEGGDALPGLAVDVYGRRAFVHVYDAQWRPHLQAVADALLAAGRVEGVYATFRTRDADEPNTFVAGERAPEDSLDVVEAGLRYRIHLGAGAPTGLYLDQRDNRVKVAELSAGATLLNTFSYTGSFSLAAAARGAKTTSVDLAKGALETARKNFAANGLDLAGHRFFTEDVFVFLPRLARRGEQYAVVLLDPPTFARGKKGVFSVEKNYGELVNVAAPLVAPGGRLVAFANTHRMSAAAWAAQVAEALPRGEFAEEAHWSQAPDFRADPRDPNGAYLKNVVLRRR